MPEQNITISLVVPMHDEGDNVCPFYTRVRDVMDGLGEPWELVCVNDGSRDDTLARLLKLRAKDPRVVVVDLSRNFGHEAALLAGLDHASGAAVIPMDADLQDPPEVIPQLVQKWREGFDVVNAVRASRAGESRPKRLTAYFFYRVMNFLSDVDIPADTGNFRLLSRQALDAVTQLPERRRFTRGLFAWVGFRSASVYYEREPRHSGETKYNYWRMWNLAIEGITSFSHIPLQLSSWIGFLVSASAFGYAIYLVATTLVDGNPVRGWPSTMVVILFLGGVQLLALGVIGEYVGRIYSEVKRRPTYIVRRLWSGQHQSETPISIGNDSPPWVDVAGGSEENLVRGRRGASKDLHS